MGMAMMQAGCVMSERDAQRQRTGGGMKQSGMQPAGMGPGMSNGLNGMMAGKGSIPRVDPRMGSGHISFGVDAYNAFRGMFENSGPIGINIGAGLSGSGLIGQGYSAPMRGSGSMGLPSLGADFVARFNQQSQQQVGGEGGDSRFRESEPLASASKAQYDDLENVADILTFGGRCVESVSVWVSGCEGEIELSVLGFWCVRVRIESEKRSVQRGVLVMRRCVEVLCDGFAGLEFGVQDLYRCCVMGFVAMGIVMMRW